MRSVFRAKPTNIQKGYAALPKVGCSQDEMGFTHTFHRVIHRKRGKKHRNTGITGKVIHIVHNLSTKWCPLAVSVDKPGASVNNPEFTRKRTVGYAHAMLPQKGRFSTKKFPGTWPGDFVSAARSRSAPRSFPRLPRGRGRCSPAAGSARRASRRARRHCGTPPRRS